MKIRSVDDQIGQFVGVVFANRELFGKDLATATDGMAQGVTGLAPAQTIGNSVYDFLPGPFRYQGVDALVGQYLDPVFKEADQNQNAGVVASVMQPLLDKGHQGFFLNLGVDLRFRNQLLFQCGNKADQPFAGQVKKQESG